jgi:hypothetical protein
LISKNITNKAMLKYSLFFLFFYNLCVSQVFINELDTDNPSIDTKEFVELKSIEPLYSLDGFVMVFFNGASNQNNLSYLSIDLDGLKTDKNGIITIGNKTISPVPDRFLFDSVIQNGADAVAIYKGNAEDFPEFTKATKVNLIDALIYDTNDPDATSLMEALGKTEQWNENENGLGETQSIQRKADGSFETISPTPGANNDGSGFIFNGISISSTPTSTLNEGDNLKITFKTQNPVSEDLNFDYSLNNGGFNSNDYSGSLSVFIPSGTSTFETTISIIDDVENEGDEELRITIGAIPDEYNRLNDNIVLRVIDLDFVKQIWGSPLNPTYNLVERKIPLGYYDALIGKSGSNLKQALQDIIANPETVRSHTYGDVTNILKESDQSPLNSSQVWLMYSEIPRPKLDFQNSSITKGFWNREHIYSVSRGNFKREDAVNEADGIDIWLPSNANDRQAGFTDAHHLRAEDAQENSARSNKNYGVDYNGPAGSKGSWHGDVARAIFYMSVRYNGLNVVNGNPLSNPTGNIGDLATLLKWNVEDKSDDFEMNRNNIIYNWQKNRNPFIDYPELADYIWGDKVNQTWMSTLGTNEILASKIKFYPNPTKGNITITGIKSNTNVSIYSVSGVEVFQDNCNNDAALKLQLPTGIYIVKIASEGKTLVDKLIVQ